MRYYEIKITDPDSGKLMQEFTTLNDPNGLDMELDIPVGWAHIPGGAPYVRLWGVSLKMISQASDFNPRPGSPKGKTIAVYGGMQKGLPLANPKQSGFLCSGTIQQAFGNWLGTDMTLDFMFTAGDIIVEKDFNFSVTWSTGTVMSVMIVNTLKTVFPDYKYQVNISPKLVLNHDGAGFYGSITQFASYINTISQAIINDDTSYPGVRVMIRDKTFIVDDATTKTKPKKIEFNDLIGQITWKSSATVSLTCVMRADLQVGDYIQLPPGQVTTTAQSYAQYRQGSVFQGIFQINGIRHVGRFRNPDGISWATIIEAYLGEPLKVPNGR